MEPENKFPYCTLEYCTKLRELVKELYETAWYEYPSMFEKLFLGRIRELGIEVDV